MEIHKGIEIRGLSLFLKKQKILIIGDIHIGKDAEMRAAGILLPRFQYKEILSETRKLIKQTMPEVIIINGDVKHSFREISRDEWKYVSEYIDVLQKSAKLIMIKGNHDNMLEPIAKNKKIDLQEKYFIDDIYVCHGDVVPKNSEFKKAKTIIIGHQHPSVTLQEGARVERYKCFLKGKYKSKTLIVMPAFNPLSQGNDLLKERVITPFIKDSEIRNFEIYIIEDEVYYFGKLSNLEKL